ncbi:MFS transporter [Kocuria sp.]|uniref:MFS transporter n=1 Tax=Kocuria sp. TaxID=1871328 RepID=UPI0026DF652A|nr:MFS transporter [Kocuria sp.]MDO5618990.1 MFS transporter [Kocuria sp.]
MARSSTPSPPQSGSHANNHNTVTTGRAVIAIIALSMGGFAIGTTEFMTMGVLPQIAESLNITEPQAGHAISAYALGVVVGVPLLSILGARLPRKGLLLGLMGAYGAFNVLSALATSYELFALARFFDGMPHGAYFGVASLVAAGLVSPQYRGRAVAGVLIGLSVANVIGVPAATWLGQNYGWRSTYIMAAGISLLTVVLVMIFVPRTPGDPNAKGLAEAKDFFRRSQVWLTMGAGAVGFGGLFAIYSYIATTITDVGGLNASTVPLFLLAFGLGMTVGTWLAGELARWSIRKSLLLGSAGSAAVMIVFWFVIPGGWWALPVLFLITAVSSILVTNLQLRLMDVAGDAVTLGAAMNHASLNLANALGAWMGGLVIAAGLGYRTPSLVGAAMALAGAAILLVAFRLEDNQSRSS